MKICNRCGIGTDFYLSTVQPCKECIKIRNNKYYRRPDPESGLSCGQRKYYRRREHRLKTMKSYRDVVRLEVLSHYSGGFIQCKCCGETDLMFLGIDHITPVGRRNKRGQAADGSPRGGTSLMSWLKKRGYPNGYRVLCHNCNLGRHINGGICPHETRNAKTA